MGFLVQRRIAGIEEVDAMIGAICVGLAYAASMVSSKPLTPMIMDPAMKD
jgi:hypothetical protein